MDEAELLQKVKNLEAAANHADSRAAAIEGALIEVITALSENGAFDGSSLVERLRKLGAEQKDPATKQCVTSIGQQVKRRFGMR